jgi:hypothetical protein
VGRRVAKRTRSFPRTNLLRLAWARSHLRAHQQRPSSTLSSRLTGAIRVVPTAAIQLRQRTTSPRPEPLIYLPVSRATMLRRSYRPRPVCLWPSEYLHACCESLLTSYSLSSMESELELQASVTEAFSEYGAVWVKIRRDNKNMPYAFCQYTVRI